MHKIIAALLAVVMSWSIPALAASTKIDDPVKFVTTLYAKTVGKSPEPDDIYTARLDALFKLAAKEAGNEVGRIDFDFWSNSQDGDVSDVAVSQREVEGSKSRSVVIAKFKNSGRANEIHFYFEKTASGWKLDDARSLLGEQWVLSLILKYGWDTAE